MYCAVTNITQCISELIRHFVDNKGHPRLQGMSRALRTFVGLRLTLCVFRRISSHVNAFQHVFSRIWRCMGDPAINHRARFCFHGSKSTVRKHVRFYFFNDSSELTHARILVTLASGYADESSPVVFPCQLFPTTSCNAHFCSTAVFSESPQNFWQKSVVKLLCQQSLTFQHLLVQCCITLLEVTIKPTSTWRSAIYMNDVVFPGSECNDPTVEFASLERPSLLSRNSEIQVQACVCRRSLRQNIHFESTLMLIMSLEM